MELESAIAIWAPEMDESDLKYHVLGKRLVLYDTWLFVGQGGAEGWLSFK